MDSVEDTCDCMACENKRIGVYMNKTSTTILDILTVLVIAIFIIPITIYALFSIIYEHFRPSNK